MDSKKIKQELARLLQARIDKGELNKTKLSDLLHCSRQQIDKLLDPDYPTITLSTLLRAIKLTDKKLVITFVNDEK